MHRVFAPCIAALLLAVAPARAVADAAGDRARDLEIARTAYVEKSRAFSEASRAQAIRFIAARRARAASMTPEQFLLTVMAITAFADNGHDSLHHEKGAWFPTARLPLRMIWFADGWVVARCAPEVADLLGASVLRIEGLSPEAMLARLRPLVGGTDAYRRWNAQWVIESAGLLHALGVARRSDALEMELELADGRRVRRTLAFVAEESLPKAASPERLLLPEPLPAEADKGWRTAPAAAAPLYQQDAARNYRIAPLPELAALYVQFRSHLDFPQETLAAFTQAIDAAMRAEAPRHLIVDLRLDTGGNADLTRDWIRTLPDRVPGRIYLLVGPYTFSAGIVAAAAIKHDGGAKVRIVGEPVGDRLVWWSEGENACLPFSHYCPHVTTGQWNLERGCQGLPGCYGDPYEVTVGTLGPDLSAPLTRAAWLAGRDPALDAIRRELSRPAPGSSPAASLGDAQPQGRGARSRYRQGPVAAR